MSDIVINDPEISRHHARLIETENSYELQDMGSTNGTFINGKRLKGDPILLVPNQVIALGSNVALIYQQVNTDELSKTSLSLTEDSQLPATGTLDNNNLLGYKVSPQKPFPTDKLPSEDDYPPRPILPTYESTFEPLAPSKFVEEPRAVYHDYTPSEGIDTPQDNNKKRRTITIAVVTVLLLCCGCIAFVYIFYMYLGDILLRELGLISQISLDLLT